MSHICLRGQNRGASIHLKEEFVFAARAPFSVQSLLHTTSISIKIRKARARVFFEQYKQTLFALRSLRTGPPPPPPRHSDLFLEYSFGKQPVSDISKITMFSVINQKGLFFEEFISYLCCKRFLLCSTQQYLFLYISFPSIVTQPLKNVKDFQLRFIHNASNFQQYLMILAPKGVSIFKKNICIRLKKTCLQLIIQIPNGNLNVRSLCAPETNS